MNRIGVVVVCVAGVVSLRCGGSSGEKAGEPKPVATTPKASTAATAKPAAPPYVYPAPVKGHYEDANAGTFDLVDGIAYTSEAGTVILASEKSIASPVLASSACPMTHARALMLIRNAHALEVTLDGSGKSPYWSSASPYDGQSREEGPDGRYWKSAGGKPENGQIAGKETYRGKGAFEYGLPVYKPTVNEVSIGEQVSGRRFDETRRAPTEAELSAAYVAVRKAALAKDLEGMLVAQGFDAKQVEAIRGLPGIDADLPAHADRFLEPGTAEEPDVRPGYGQVGSRGKNSKGASFANYYEFAPCGDKLVLVSIGLNPQ